MLFKVLRNMLANLGNGSEAEGPSRSSVATSSSSSTASSSSEMPPMPQHAFMSHELEADFERLAQSAASIQVGGMTGYFIDWAIFILPYSHTLL